MKKLFTLAGIFIFCSSFNFGQGLQTAPLNPEYIRYLELKEQGLWKRTTDQGYTLGYVPSPFEFITSDISLKEIKDLPSSFDLRNVNGQSYLTPVKHQGSCGSCWAFSTMAAIESRLLMLDEGHYNLSENHLKQNHGFDWGPCAGGNHYLSTAYLSRGSGTILEAEAPYYDYDHSSYNGNPPVMYHTDAVFLPKNENIIKQVIMEYGALYTSMRFEDESYNASDYTYYYHGSDNSNHAVNIVGWDDNKQTAGGNGAWIVKNSWGINWGESGYFYIAYQDTRVNSAVAYWPYKIDYASNRVIDYSDHLGSTWSVGYGTNTGYALIKFTPDKDHELLTLGTYIVASGATVGFEVYDNFNNGNLSNLLGNIPNQTIDYAGYTTFELSTPIDLSAGNDFFVKVYYYTPDHNFPIPVEREWSNYSYPSIDHGVSWVSSNGTSWTQVGGGTDYPWNLCVKTYGLAPIDDDDPEQNTITFNVKDQHNQPVSDAKITITPGGSKTIAGLNNIKNTQGNPRAANISPQINREGYIEIAEFDYARQNQSNYTPKSDNTEVILPGNWAEAAAVGTYRWTDGDGNSIGWIFGNNTYGDTGTGMQFNVQETHTIVGAYFWISTAASGSGNLHFRVYDFNGAPGAVIASKTVALNNVVAFPTGEGVTPDQFPETFYVEFDNPITVHGDFFVGVDFSGLTWNTHGDGIGMASTLVGQGGGGLDRAFIRGSDGVWVKATSYNAALDLDIGVFPVIQTETEPTILYTDAGGQASFQVSDGNYTYTVEKTGHTTYDGNFTVSGNNVNIQVTLLTDTEDDEYHTFHYETFGGGSIPVGWSNVVIQGPSGFPGWEYTTTGAAYGGVLESTTANDGYMKLDSDAHGMPGTAEEADLISSAFDFSSINTEILFSVEHLARTYGNADIRIYISTDGFDTQTLLYRWHGAPQNEFNGSNPVYSLFDITDIAQGESNVQIKFKWIGEWDYWWLIDDFKIMVKDYEDEDPDPDYSTVSFQVTDQNQKPVSDAKITITPGGSKTIFGLNNIKNTQGNPKAEDISTQINREGLIEIATFDFLDGKILHFTKKTDNTEVLLPGNWAEAAAVGTYRWTDGDGNPLGWIFGNNTYGDTGAGMHFNVEETYTIVGAYFWIGQAASGSGDVHFHIQEFNGEPGDALTSATVALNDLVPFPTGEGVSPDDYLEAFYVEFDNPVEVTGDFFVSVVFGDLAWNEHGDGIAMSSTVIGQGGGGLDRTFIQGSDGVWVKATSYNAALNLDVGVFPLIQTETEPIILYTDAGGQASAQVSDGNYTYTVEKTGHTSSDGEFTVSGADINIHVTLLAVTDNIMQIHDITAVAGSIITVEVEIINEDEFVAFNADIPIPAGFTYIEGSAQLHRDDGHFFNFEILPGNVARMISAAVPTKPFLGNDGVIVSFDLQTPSDEGTFTLCVEDAVIADEDGFNIMTGDYCGTITITEDNNTVTFSVTNYLGESIDNAIITFGGVENPAGDYVFENIEQGTHQYTVEKDCYLMSEGVVVVSGQDVHHEVVLENILGDANNDGVVNVSDIVIIVNYFLGQSPDPFCFINADVNGDGVINVSDVVGATNIFMGGKVSPHDALKSEKAQVYLYPDGIYIKSDGTLTAMQFELTGKNLEALSMVLALPNHQIMYSTKDNEFIAMVFSISNTPIAEGKVKIIGFEPGGNQLHWGEVLVANLNAELVNVETHTDEATDVADIGGFENIQVYPNPAKDMLWIEFVNNLDQPINISLINIHGQLIQHQTINDTGPVKTSMEISELTAGAYILKLGSTYSYIIKKIIIR